MFEIRLKGKKSYNCEGQIVFCVVSIRTPLFTLFFVWETRTWRKLLPDSTLFRVLRSRIWMGYIIKGLTKERDVTCQQMASEGTCRFHQD